MERRPSSNFILSLLLPQLDKRKAKASIRYKHGMPGLELRGKNIDMEELFMFSIGSAMEVYKYASENSINKRVFCLAAKDTAKELLARIERDIEEMEK